MNKGKVKIVPDDVKLRFKKEAIEEVSELSKNPGWMKILDDEASKKINAFAFPFGQEHLHWCQNDVSILQNLGLGKFRSFFVTLVNNGSKSFFHFPIP